jgi:hypothetical protein
MAKLLFLAPMSNGDIVQQGDEGRAENDARESNVEGWVLANGEGGHGGTPGTLERVFPQQGYHRVGGDAFVAEGGREFESPPDCWVQQQVVGKQRFSDPNAVVKDVQCCGWHGREVRGRFRVP